MFFQPLDKKQECRLFYYEDTLNERPPNSPTATWKYVQYLSSVDDLKFVNLYCAGKTLGEVCPDDLKEEWGRVTQKLRAYMRTFELAKINLEDICFYDSIPEIFLLQYFDLKNQITEYVYNNFPEPENYDFLLDITRLVESIRKHQLNVDVDRIKNNFGKYKTRQFVKKISSLNPYIDYNIFGTKTGRLTTLPNSFPIMTLDRDHRSILKPNNDVFVELDYNAAELRVFLGLLGIPQPKGDIHAWIGQSVFKGGLSRDMVKKKVFAWLYNPQAENVKLEKLFNKGRILEKYYDGEYISTPFGRKIKSDQHHALNYIIQSTTSDMFLRQMIKADRIIKNTDSHIAFSIHDSFVVDLKRDNRDILEEIIRIFSDTYFGSFKVNLSIGKDFGNMRQISTN